MSSSVAPDPLIGQVIDNRYRIIKLIARGGMAKVYQAEQIHLNRLVAIKVLDPKHVGADDPEFQKRFELEAQMTSQLNHPNTVTIHDYGFNAKKHFYYFVMEFIQGKTLRRAMKEENVFALDRALHIAIQVARSVRQAHSVGVIHRDLKPSNILLTTHDKDENYVKVVDFGLLKLKKESSFDGEKTEGVLMGSPRYMSPEQIKRQPVDHRTDIYSLGVNIYQMLTGRPPFTGSSAVQILMGHLNQPPPPFTVANPNVRIPQNVEKFVMQCLEKSPDKRPKNMDEVVEQIISLQSNGKKAGIYSSIPVDSKSEVIGAGRNIEQKGITPAEKQQFQDEAVSQSTSPQAWSDTQTQSPFYEPIVVEPGQPSIPIDIEMKTGGRKKLSPLSIVFFIMIVIILGSIVAAGVLLMSSRTRGIKNAGSIPNESKQINIAHKREKKQEINFPSAGEQVQKEEKIKTYKISFSTNPSEANVFEGETFLCKTPCDVEWTITEQRKIDSRQFTIVKEGFEPVEIVQPVPDSDVSIGVPLVPIEEQKQIKVKSPKTQKIEKTEKPPQENEPAPPSEKGKEKGKEGLKLIQDYPEG